MTNAERIRQMTDEELAEWFAPHMQCKTCPLRGRRGGCDLDDCKKGAEIFLQRYAPDAEMQDPAHWILDDNGEAYCSECHCEGEPYMCYCPMCGKKMGGGA